jgi:hypothetical protein
MDSRPKPHANIYRLSKPSSWTLDETRPNFLHTNAMVPTAPSYDDFSLSLSLHEICHLLPPAFIMLFLSFSATYWVSLLGFDFSVPRFSIRTVMVFLLSGIRFLVHRSWLVVISPATSAAVSQCLVSSSNAAQKRKKASANSLCSKNLVVP